MAFVTLPTIAVGDPVTAEYLNQGKDNDDWLKGRIGDSANARGTYSVARSATAVPLLLAEQHDPGGLYDATTGEFTADIDGDYRLDVRCEFELDSTETITANFKIQHHDGVSWSDVHTLATLTVTGIDTVTELVNTVHGINLDQGDKLRIVMVTTSSPAGSGDFGVIGANSCVMLAR